MEENDDQNCYYWRNVNMRNTGLITNLPPDCAVEVPCLVDEMFEALLPWMPQFQTE